MINITVLFFATYRDIFGVKQLNLDIPENSNAQDLLNILGMKYSIAAEQLSTAIVSINREFAFENDIIPDNAEIAVFPPVSGGTTDFDINLLDIVEEEISVDSIIKQIITEESGAVSIFCGIVRGVTWVEDEKTTEYLSYQAYKPMAMRKLRQVAKEIRENYPSIHGIAIIQRIGKLIRGTPTVIIACSAAHRDSGAFEAARYGIDRLKEIVPIWKMEHGLHGDEWLEGNYYPTPQD